MKTLMIILISISTFANDPVLTPPTKESSGCNVKYHLGLNDKKEFLDFHVKLVAYVKEGNKKKLAGLMS